jgi:hypothetical protein
MTTIAAASAIASSPSFGDFMRGARKVAGRRASSSPPPATPASGRRMFETWRISRSPLSSPTHDNRVYSLTGPAALTFGEMARQRLDGRRSADAAQVDRDDPEPRREPRHDPRVGRPVLRKPVNEDQRRALAAGHVVQRRAVHLGGVGRESGRHRFVRARGLPDGERPLMRHVSFRRLAPGDEHQGERRDDARRLRDPNSGRRIHDRHRTTWRPGGSRRSRESLVNGRRGASRAVTAVIRGGAATD